MLLGAILLASTGCKSAQRFDTGPGGAFCGDLIAGSADGLIPDGSTTNLSLALTLSTQHLSDYPGVLGVQSSSDDSGGLCAGQRLFDKASVRAIQPALKDVIASIQITPDHDQDIFTWVDSSCQGTFLSIVSLMNDGSVEVRLFKPAHETDAGAPANVRAGFGVFRLARSDSGCGF
jgi:hypothetical protein